MSAEGVEESIFSLQTLMIGILAATGGGMLSAIINGFFYRKRTSAEVDNTRSLAMKAATEATLQVIKDLRDEITRLGDRSARAEERATKAEYELIILRMALIEYRRRVDHVTRLLESAGIVVDPWTPPPSDGGNGHS